MTLELAKNLLRSAPMPMREGLLYEPRAFWSTAAYDTSAATSRRPPNIIRLPREHFYNGEAFPITLLYALVCPIGYTFDVYENSNNPTEPTSFRNCGAAAISDAQLAIGSPQRQQYMRIAGLSQSMRPSPRWEPPWIVTDSEAPSRGPIYNTFTWELSSPMVIPNRANLDFDLSSYTLPSFASAPGDGGVRATIGFSEIGSGNMKGLGRFMPMDIGAQEVDPGVATLFAPDGFGFAPGGESRIWRPNQGISAREFSAQNQSSDGSVPIVGWSVMLDQQEYDSEILASAPVGTSASSVIASLGTRIGTRARMRQGGSGRFWWREGAPLALVSPHRTPAQVHDFHQPITLGPGDELEVELTLPTAYVEGQTTYNRITQIGVSFCGYAAIEG